MARSVRGWLAWGLLLAAGGPAVVAAEAESANAEAIAARAKEVFRVRCHECHGGAAVNADVDVLDRDLLVEKRKVVVPGQPDDSRLMQVVLVQDDNMMPPEGQPRPNAEEIAAIRNWIAAGAPAFPADIAPTAADGQQTSAASGNSVEYVLQAVLNHARALSKADRRHARYFSINHLLAAGATRAELDLHRDALAKAINHLSLARNLVRPTVVDEPASTLFYFDVRDLLWDKEPYQAADDDSVESLPGPLDLWDLALLEYPYAAVFEDSTTFDALLEEYCTPAGLARPVPFVRADWFVSVVTQPPLYEDFLQLPFDEAALEAQLGVDVEKNLRDGVAKRAGMTVSGVSRNNRVVERHPSRHGSYWKSLDFASSKGLSNMFRDPLHPKFDGGEMIFTLPNGLQGYYVATSAGVRLDAAPTQIVTDKFADDKTVRNGLACMRCHDQGMKTFRDNIRAAVELLPGSPGFDKRQVLQMYPAAEEMDALVSEDGARFLAAMEEALGHPQAEEPLIPVTRRFLEAPLQLSTAAGELGLAAPGDLAAVFRTPQFASLGLIPLASQGVVRRDMWEDYYDRVVRQLGLGMPVIPIDGVTRRDYPADSPPFEVELTTNKPNNIFAPGDELAIFVSNRSTAPLHVELVGTSAQGQKVILAASTTTVPAGGKFRFPPQGTLKIQGGKGAEQITLLASDKQFPAGRLLRGEGVTDRVVRPFFDATRMVKRTLLIETR